MGTCHLRRLPPTVAHATALGALVQLILVSIVVTLIQMARSFVEPQDG